MAAGWTAGLLAGSFIPQTYDLIIIPTALILFILMKFLFKFKLREILTVLIVFVSAVGLYRIYDNFVCHKIMSYTSQEVSFDGKITDMSEHAGDKCTYYVKGKINGRDNAEITVYYDLYECSINDHLKFTGIVQAPENDYLFEAFDYNKSKGIFLTCFDVKSFEIVPDESFSVKRLLYEYRKNVTDFVNRNLPSDQSSMVCGMLFGDKSGMSDNDKTLFYRMGIGHVMAVSGLHLVLFCMMFSFVFDRLRLGRIKRFIFLEFLMAAFAICSGLSDSILRASLMMTISNLAPLFFRKADTLNSISIAFIILTALNPFSITNPSLVLSVTGTFGAGVFAPFITRNFKEDTFIKRQLKNAVYMFFVSLAVMPFSIIFFGESSLVSPLANIFLTPVCMAALMISLIASLLVFLNPVFLIKLSGILCELVMLVVRQIGKLEFSGVNFTAEMKYISAAAVLICVTVFLIFKTRRALVVSTAVSFTLFALSAFSGRLFMSDKLNIALMGDKGIDVIVLSQSAKAEVIDISGRKKNANYALKFLEQSNISTLESIIIRSNGYQAMSAYDRTFSFIDAGSVIMPDGTFVREDMTVCGYKPQFSDFLDLTSEFDNVKIQINGTKISVKYGEFELVCDSSCNDSEALVYAEYENVFNPPKANLVIVPEYENICGFDNIVTSRNVHIVAGKDGDFLTGGL